MPRSPIRKKMEQEYKISIKPGDKLLYNNDQSNPIMEARAKSAGKTTDHPVIYTGNDKVVHAQNPNQDGRGVIKKNPIRSDGFKNNQGHSGSSEATVQRAENSVGKTFHFNLETQNCQDFAEYCQGEKSFSFSNTGYVDVMGDNELTFASSGSGGDCTIA